MEELTTLAKVAPNLTALKEHFLPQMWEALMELDLEEHKALLETMELIAGTESPLEERLEDIDGIWKDFILTSVRENISEGNIPILGICKMDGVATTEESDVAITVGFSQQSGFEVMVSRFDIDGSLGLARTVVDFFLTSVVEGEVSLDYALGRLKGSETISKLFTVDVSTVGETYSGYRDTTDPIIVLDDDIPVIRIVQHTHHSDTPLH